MEIPSLATLFSEYATRWQVPQSRLRPSDLDVLQVELGVALPSDYRTLLLSYDFTHVEIRFTQFHPTLAESKGIVAAVSWALNGTDAPFTALLRQWQVIPVGEDWTGSYLVLSIRQTTRHQEGSGDVASEANRPFGTMWVWDPEGRDDMLAFVSSSFSQALHLALYLDHIRDELKDGRQEVGSVMETLESIDPAIHGRPYWPRWIANIMRR